MCGRRWRLKTLDGMVAKLLYTELASDGQAAVGRAAAETVHHQLVEQQMCLPPPVRARFRNMLPPAHRRYRPSQLRPYSFGTDGKQSVALQVRAAAAAAPRGCRLRPEGPHEWARLFHGLCGCIATCDWR